VAKVPIVAAARSLAGRHLIRSPPVTRSETADPGLFRPWRDDRRPVWEVTARWTSPIRHSDDDLSYLADTLTATGMARAPRLAAGDGWLSATLYVKASGPEAAELVAVRVVEVAHRAARLGALGSTVAGGVERARLRRLAP